MSIMGTKFRTLAGRFKSSRTRAVVNEIATLFDNVPYNGAALTKADLTTVVQAAVTGAAAPIIDFIHPHTATPSEIDRALMPTPIQIVGRNFGVLDDPTTSAAAVNTLGVRVPLTVLNVWPDGTGANVETQGLDPTFLTTFADGGNLYVTSHGITSAPFPFTVSP